MRSTAVLCGSPSSARLCRRPFVVTCCRCLPVVCSLCVFVFLDFFWYYVSSSHHPPPPLLILDISCTAWTLLYYIHVFLQCLCEASVPKCKCSECSARLCSRTFELLTLQDVLLHMVVETSARSSAQKFLAHCLVEPSVARPRRRFYCDTSQIILFVCTVDFSSRLLSRNFDWAI